MKEKCNTNVRQSKKQQRNRGRNFQRKGKKRKKRIEGAKEEVRKEEEERKKDINMIFNEIRGEVEIRRQKMIERCEMISKRKGSSFSFFHYYYYFEHKQNKTTEKAIEEYLQELKEEEVLEMAEIEIKAVERVIGETEVGVCSCGPTLNDRVTSFLLFQVFSSSFSPITYTCEKQTQTNTARKCSNQHKDSFQTW